jgi:hypothetical protein
LNGEKEDGSPELWDFWVEQEEIPGQWESVDAVCQEHPAFDFIVLRPGQDIESWIMAVDFPKPNQRFGMCSRKASHLEGKIRAGMRYYVDPCELDDPLESPVYTSTSEAVSYPASQN